MGVMQARGRGAKVARRAACLRNNAVRGPGA